MPALGTCSARTCEKPATQVVKMEGVNRLTGQSEIRDLAVCPEHLADLTSPCANEGCGGLGWYVVGISGEKLDGTHVVDDEVRLCAKCWEELQQSAIATINGVSMVHDGHGNLKALPASRGEG